ncbi:hypothetical protein QE390_003557 [Siphonobacter sp. SORGH_AS 1065]|nr:hypothetical protein [Siphonobacter sp. SORGH_AS_1065]
MPVDYKKYHPKWSLISRLIRFNRAGNCCEFCGVKNEALIVRNGSNYRYATDDETAIFLDYRTAGIKYWQALKKVGLTRIILTVAHLDRNIENNRFNNLKSLCQYCHLNYDRPENIRLKNYGKDDSTLSLFDT